MAGLETRNKKFSKMFSGGGNISVSHTISHGLLVCIQNILIVPVLSERVPSL